MEEMDEETRVEMVNRAHVLMAIGVAIHQFKDLAGNLPRYVAVGILAVVRRWSGLHPEHAWDELVRDADETVALATKIRKGQTN